MRKLYDVLLEAPKSGRVQTVLIHLWGEGTEFEAISRVDVDTNTGQWDGFLIFKDERFSPGDPDLPGLQFKYQTPQAGNGILAEIRAEATWKTLVGIFQALMGGVLH